jgi:hypothetical protein
MVGYGATDVVDIPNVTAQGSVPWRGATWNWAVEHALATINSGERRAALRLGAVAAHRGRRVGREGRGDALLALPVGQLDHRVLRAGVLDREERHGRLQRHGRDRLQRSSATSAPRPTPAGATTPPAYSAVSKARPREEPFARRCGRRTSKCWWTRRRPTTRATTRRCTRTTPSGPPCRSSAKRRTTTSARILASDGRRGQDHFPRPADHGGQGTRKRHD